jgi:mannose-6-phosphate isomerase class I
MSETALNFIENTDKHKLIIGLTEIGQLVINLLKKGSFKKKYPLLALDGFIGVEWKQIVSELKEMLRKENFRVKDIDIASCYKSSAEIEKIVSPFLTDDPVFGIIFKGRLENFLVQEKAKELRKAFKTLKGNDVVICYGCGAANKRLTDLYDFIFYVDITREEVGRRIKKNLVYPLGSKPKSKKVRNSAEDNSPIYLATKRFYYIEYPVLDAYKRHLLPQVDFYIDGNITGEPKLISQRALNKILSKIAQYPFRIKPYYDPGPWGGQWLKRVRKLPESMPNCAWSYEIMGPEVSLKIAIGDNYLEIPFPLLLWQRSCEIMGEEATKRFHDNFPIRVNYDESIGGGDMAIQVHPNTSYIKKHFNEWMGQDESYYIVAAGPGAKVYLGLREKIDKDELYKRVRRAEIDGIPFDHEQYVNSIPSKTGDLFLIPAGTVHASGRNEVVLEISATTYRYTFHLYDYLRPDLDGKLRPIHSHHAFQVIKFFRRSHWVAKNLKQKPSLVKSGKGWATYLLGKRKDMFFVVYRLEFTKKIEEETGDKFHILNLVEGDSVLVQSQRHPERRFRLDFSETLIVPACIAKYSIINLSDRPCKVLKILLK